eukprot:CAMPEP_0169463860 /NCGR_PEP_ID=MMETSP1042-20121227/20340_1 /TAXON_ID=464988 /ORGANISM="Hemiselmis andersenii, Strain CCMP1180" /LENGTH=112 /DNA_ID=CAMNT_0009576635 /DNA_START=18 /DNA_END=353 /DNA_ORIENTATION=-
MTLPLSTSTSTVTNVCDLPSPVLIIPPLAHSTTLGLSVDSSARDVERALKPMQGCRHIGGALTPASNTRERDVAGDGAGDGEAEKDVLGIASGPATEGRALGPKRLGTSHAP